MKCLYSLESFVDFNQDKVRMCVCVCVRSSTAVDECTLNTDNCDNAEAICTDTVGTFTCACNDGWTTVDDGVTCTCGSCRARVFVCDD